MPKFTGKMNQLKMLEFIGLILVLLALTFGFFTRVITVFEYTIFDIGPDPDQVMGGYILMDIWKGNIPHIGPPGGGGKYGFAIPPLGYFLFFPFTILGANPSFQVLANGVFSFLSIPLLIYLIYQLLEKVESSKRFFLASLAGLWYSTFYAEYFTSNYTWLPNFIPFFLMIAVLLYKYQLETKDSLYRQAISWILYGIVLAILVSLHSTTLFVMPIVYIITSLWFVYKNRKNFRKCLLPFLTIIASNLALLPYWKLEIARHFFNTKAIFAALTSSNSGEVSQSLLSRLAKVLWEYINLSNQFYIIGDQFSYLRTFLSIIFVSLGLYFGLRKFQGNKTILCFLGLVWLVFLYAVSGYQEQYFFVHRKILIWFAPLIFCVISLAYLGFSRKIEKVVVVTLYSLILFSIITNLAFNYRYLSSKYGTERMMSVADMIDVFKQLPDQATICDPQNIKKRVKYNQYDYLDTYITKKQFKIVNTCQPGDYRLYPKFTMDIQINDQFPLFKLSQQPPFSKPANLVLETPETYVYQIK